MKVKSRLILLVSIWETLQLIFITWVIEKALNFLAKRLAIRFKGKAHLGYFYWRIYGGTVMNINLPYILSFKTMLENERFLSESKAFFLIVRSALYVHKMMHKHKVLKMEKCKYCKTIIENKSFLQIYAHNPKLYPPFKFSRSS